jgi:hypothetical protein
MGGLARLVLRRLLDNSSPEADLADNDFTWSNGFLAESNEVLSPAQVLAYVAVSICLVLMAGLMSGLTLG